MKEWSLTIEDGNGEVYSVTFEDLERWKDPSIPVEEFVPRKQAEAVYVTEILRRLSISEDFSSVVFMAEDGFKQKARKDDLNEAFFVFKHDGEPLSKGYPVRLYVPDGKSDCLNVKSVVQTKLIKE